MPTASPLMGETPTQEVKMDDEPKAATRTKYRVFKANIVDDDGVKKFHGEEVELTAATARRYNKLGFLKPFIEDDDEDEADEKPKRTTRATKRV